MSQFAKCNTQIRRLSLANLVKLFENSKNVTPSVPAAVREVRLALASCLFKLK
jgi:hypothetical protein